MELKRKLGSRIQELRLKNNMTQSELAEKVDIATKHQSCIENGKNFPSSDLIEKYANVFQMDVSDLLNLTHIIDTNTQIEEIINLLKKAKKEDITLIYKIVKSLFY